MPAKRSMTDTETKAARALSTKIIDLVCAEGSKLATGGADPAAIDVILTNGQILALVGFHLTAAGDGDALVEAVRDCLRELSKNAPRGSGVIH